MTTKLLGAVAVSRGLQAFLRPERDRSCCRTSVARASTRRDRRLRVDGNRARARLVAFRRSTGARAVPKEPRDAGRSERAARRARPLGDRLGRRRRPRRSRRIALPPDDEPPPLSRGRRRVAGTRATCSSTRLNSKTTPSSRRARARGAARRSATCKGVVAVAARGVRLRARHAVARELDVDGVAARAGAARASRSPTRGRDGGARRSTTLRRASARARGERGAPPRRASVERASARSARSRARCARASATARAGDASAPTTRSSGRRTHARVPARRRRRSSTSRTRSTATRIIVASSTPSTLQVLDPGICLAGARPRAHARRDAVGHPRGDRGRTTSTSRGDEDDRRDRASARSAS